MFSMSWRGLYSSGTQVLFNRCSPIPKGTVLIHTVIARLPQHPYYGKRGKAKIQGNMLVFKVQIISKLHIPLQLTFNLTTISHISTSSWKEIWEISSNSPTPAPLITQVSAHTLLFPYMEHTHPSPNILRQVKVTSSYCTHLKI